MKRYFKNKKRINRLERNLNEWIGTPYMHHTGVKQRGCDCIHFIARILEEMNLGKWKIPWYPKDWHLHDGNERLLISMQSVKIFHEGNIDDPQNGDIVLYKFGKVTSHAGFYMKHWIYHCITDLGVERTSWEHPQWYKRRSYLFSVLEVV